MKVVEGYLAQGYGRIKIKIKPGRDIGDTQAVRRAFPDIRLQVDANSAYTLETAPALRPLDDLGLLLIEQPLDEDDLWDHRLLQAEFRTPICLDESILSARHAAGAGDGRVPGDQHQGRARRRAERGGSHPQPVRGGRDSGLVRRDAGNRRRPREQPGAGQPARLHPARRHLGHRALLRETSLTRRFALNPDSTIDVPTGPGLGVTVDRRSLAQFTLASLEIRE